jgi:hypothetical protein
MIEVYSDDKGFFVNLAHKAYLIMYILSIFLLYSVSDSDETIIKSFFMTAVICLISISIIQYWIPDFINKKRKRGDFILKETMIWTGNVASLIRKTLVLLVTMMVGIIVFQMPLLTVAKIDTVKLLIYESHLGIFLFLISFSILFKVITEINQRKNMYKQLNLMGYSKKQIINTIRKEVIAYYSVFSVLAFLPLVVVSIAKIMKTSISSIYVCALLLLPFLAIILLAAITYILYEKIVLKTIKGC